MKGIGSELGAVSEEEPLFVGDVFVPDRSVKTSSLPVRPSSRISASGANQDQLLERGCELLNAGEPDQALKAFQEILQQNDQLATAHHHSGEAWLQKGDVAAAIQFLKTATQLDPSNAHFLCRLGEALQAAGDLPAAILAFEQSLRVDPLHPGTWTSLSEVLLQMGEVTPSLDCLKQALHLDSRFPAARLLLGNVHKQMGDLEEAAANYRFVLEQSPENVVAAVNLASVLRTQGETLPAIKLLRDTLGRGMTSPLIAYNLANTLVDVGEFAEARIHYESAIPHHPRPAKVFFNLASITRFQPEARPKLTTWKKTVESRIHTNEELAYYHFALGKTHDDLGEFETAINHYHEGNAHVPVMFDPLAHQQEITKTVESWSHDFIKARQSWGVETNAPVFIFGMPRSGTTLVEQILAGHAQVMPLGEREEMGKLIAAHADSIGSSHNLPQAARHTTEADYHALSELYLKDVQLPAGKHRFTDKMPSNFLLLGWIATLYPNASLIHCRRDPRDTCLSCYFQHFNSRLPYSYDLRNLAVYYREYERLMAYWHAIFPGRILDVSYEDLIDAPEAQARRIADHVELDWDTNCLQTQAVERAVRTASGWQVRQPIYKTSVARWKNYEQWIQPLIEGLATKPISPDPR